MRLAPAAIPGAPVKDQRSLLPGLAVSMTPRLQLWT